MSSEKKSQEIMVLKGGQRLRCPKCGNVNKNMIREVEDRDRIIYDYPVIYDKKYHCGMCGTWFRWEKE